MKAESVIQIVVDRIVEKGPFSNKPSISDHGAKFIGHGLDHTLHTMKEITREESIVILTKELTLLHKRLLKETGAYADTPKELAALLLEAAYFSGPRSETLPTWANNAIGLFVENEPKKGVRAVLKNHKGPAEFTNHIKKTTERLSK